MVSQNSRSWWWLALVVAAIAAPQTRGGRATSQPLEEAAVRAQAETKAQPPGSPRWLIDDLCTIAGVPSATCERREVAERLPGGIDIVMATVPDPERTQASMAFDEVIDALVSSASQLGFTQDRYCFPWSSRGSHGRQGREASQLCEGHRRAPSRVSGAMSTHHAGWLLFRRELHEPDRSRILLVLLVGESALQGVDQEMAEHALATARELQLAGAFTGPPLKVIGPYYSGSAASLWPLVSSTMPRPLPRVVTGSATSEMLGAHRYNVQLERTIVNDRQMFDFVVSALTERHREQASLQLAMLIEEGTEYGAKMPTHGTKDRSSSTALKIKTYRFPRHVSHVRNAHGSEELDAVGFDFQRMLKLKLDDVANQRADTPPMMSSLTPLGTELALRSTLREIARRDVTYLIIAASDVADLLYLSREARAYCPGVRLIALGGHALLSHPDLRYALSGMLVGASYPLMLENQSWQRAANEPPAQIRSFTSPSAQGIYNALQRLLASPSRPEQPLDLTSPWLRGSSGPHPWLMEVHNGRFWPLRVGANPGDREVKHPRISLPTNRFPRLLGALWLLLATAQCVVLAQRRAPWLTGVPVLRLFAPASFGMHSTAMQYRACAYLILGLIGTYLTALAWRLWVAQPTPMPQGLLVAFAIVLTAVLLVAGASLVLRVFYAGMRGLVARRRSVLRGRRLNGAYVQLVSVFIVLWMCGVAGLSTYSLVHFVRALDAPDGRLLLLRLSEPFGMCPLWPLLLPALALYFWALFGLARIRALDRFPNIGPFVTPYRFSVAARLSESCTRRCTWRARICTFELACAVFLLLASYFVGVSLLPNFEWKGFDGALLALLLTLGAAIVFSCIQATVLWNMLRELMVQLMAMPSAEAYDRIGTKMATSFGLRLRSQVPRPHELQVSVHSSELLAALAERQKDEDPAAADIRRSIPVLTELAQEAAAALDAWKGLQEGIAHSQDPARFERRVHAAFFAIARALTTVLQDVGRSRAACPSLTGMRDAAPPDSLLSTGELGALPTVTLLGSAGSVESRLWIRAAEDFVAMRSATFVYHILDQVRRLVSFSLIGASLLVFAVFGYPIQPPRFAAVASGAVLMGAVLVTLRVIVLMESSELLRRLARASQDQSFANRSFLAQLAIYVAVPVVVLAVRAFPEFGAVISHSLQPLLSVLE